VGEACDGKQAIELVPVYQPHVVLMLQQSYRKIKVIIFIPQSAKFYEVNLLNSAETASKLARASTPLAVLFRVVYLTSSTPAIAL
jgi:DNA-binding NarL/FixJ family response regulator